VGWVCALPVEVAVAQEKLDEEHEEHEKLQHDPNDTSPTTLLRHRDRCTVVA
jgi:hypothetical protein